MAHAHLEKELMIETGNQIGTAAHLTKLISEQAHSNIRAFWGGATGEKGTFAVITDDNQKVADFLKNDAEFSNFHEEDVIVVDVADKVGAAADVADKLSAAGIDINWLYTTIFDDQTAVVVSTKDNSKALKILS